MDYKIDKTIKTIEIIAKDNEAGFLRRLNTDLKELGKGRYGLVYILTEDISSPLERGNLTRIMYRILTKDDLDKLKQE